MSDFKLPESELENKKRQHLAALADDLFSRHPKAKHSHLIDPPPARPEFPKVKHSNLAKDEWLEQLEVIRADYHKDLMKFNEETRTLEDVRVVKSYLTRIDLATVELLNSIKGLRGGALQLLDGEGFKKFAWEKELAILAVQVAEAQGGSLPAPRNPNDWMVWHCLNILNNHGLATQKLGTLIVSAMLKCEAATTTEFNDIHDKAGRHVVRLFMLDNPDLMLRELDWFMLRSEKISD